MSSSVRANMIKTTSAWFQSFDNLHDPDTVLASWSDDCIHQILPKSRGHPPRNKTEYRAYIGQMSWALQDFAYLPREDTFVFDEVTRRAVFQATSKGETPIGPFANEFSFFLWFDETGEKVTRVDEFVDSKYAEDYFGRLLKVLGQGDQSEEVKAFKKKWNLA